MEPALELAIRIVAYLWLLREWFPKAHGLDDILDGDSKERSRNRVIDLGKNDHAIFSRIRELTSLPGEPAAGGWLARLRIELWSPGATRPPGRIDPETVERDVTEFFGRLTKVSECLEAKVLRWSNITREDLVENIARAMLKAPDSIEKISDGLKYKPVLILEIKQAKGKVPKVWSGSELRQASIPPKKQNGKRQDTSVPAPFSVVLAHELDEIRKSRRERYKLLNGGEDVLLKDLEADIPFRQAWDSCLFGVALSGGGIRSATFALGVLQGMADRNMLPLIDYLSTVSGGGYIGSWLVAWAKRRGSIHSVETSLRGFGTSLPCVAGPCAGEQEHQKGKSKLAATPPPDVPRNSDPHAEHVRPVRMLREYSRYLAPQAGLFSADSWTILTTWIRNTSLTFSVLALFLAALLMLPRGLTFLLLKLPDWFAALANPRILPVLAAGVPLWAACVLIALYNLRPFYYWRPPDDRMKPRGDPEWVVVATVLVFILIGAFLETAAVWEFRLYADGRLWAAIAFAVVCFVGIFLMWRLVRNVPKRQATSIPIGWGVAATVVCAVFGGLLIYLVCGLFFQNLAMDTQRGAWVATTAGPCLMLGIFSLVVGLFIAVCGRDMGDEMREWFSRLGAWILMSIAVWLIVSSICFFAPLWIARSVIALAAAGVTWVTITAAGVRLAFQPASGRDADQNQQGSFLNLIMNLAPGVFVIGFLAALSLALYYFMGRLLEYPAVAKLLIADPFAHQLCCTGAPSSWQRMVDNYWALMYPGSWLFLAAFAVLLFASIFLSLRVDVNEFSMHHFYKNRLVRAYLGASRLREHRWPNAFTDFDFEDDVRIRRFLVGDTTCPEDEWTDCQARYVGPYPIINTALNITRGDDMDRQERKAESFTFTPLWSGFDFTRKQTGVPEVSRTEYAFRPTSDFGFQNGGPFLGTAVAISGAAFTSNAGFHTSPSLAFLLTIFNVRLGWWIGNPARSAYGASSPYWGLMYLFYELTAQTNTKRNYVLLSDGGHFENMGLYELVRRRVRYVIVSDAEEDAKFKLEGIGGAIRKCRVDFGVVIDLDLEALKPLGDPAMSRLHYSVGTILYPRRNEPDRAPAAEHDCGVLVYIKSSMTGDEPVDVIEFRKRRPEFPHESTANQFFDESHFESYRALGHHAAQSIFSVDGSQVMKDQSFDPCAAFTVIFDDIRCQWKKKLAEAKRREKDDKDRAPATGGGPEK